MLNGTNMLNQLNLKATISDTYTKSDTDTKINLKADLKYIYNCIFKIRNNKKKTSTN